MHEQTRDGFSPIRQYVLRPTTAIYNTNQSVKDPGRGYDQGHVHDHVYGGRGVYGEVWHSVELHRDVGYDAVLYPVHGVGHWVQHVHDEYYPSGLVQPQVVVLEALRRPGVGRRTRVLRPRPRLIDCLHNRSEIGHRCTCVWLTAPPSYRINANGNGQYSRLRWDCLAIVFVYYNRFKRSQSRPVTAGPIYNPLHDVWKGGGGFSWFHLIGHSVI